jgi:uncharacterized protein YjbJ (UPF0337 family)
MSDQMGEKIKGVAKEAVGEATDSEELRREGEEQQEKAQKAEEAERLERGAAEKRVEAAEHEGAQQANQGT